MSLTAGIVGLPNVGKSTLFNKIVGKKISIIEDTPGVTRDRIYQEAMYNQKKFYIQTLSHSNLFYSRLYNYQSILAMRIHFF